MFLDALLLLGIVIMGMIIVTIIITIIKRKVSSRSLKDRIKKLIVKEYNDVILVTSVNIINEQAQYNIVDTSMYDDHNVIGVTLCLPKNSLVLKEVLEEKNLKEYDFDGREAINLHANVYKLKDGTFVWEL